METKFIKLEPVKIPERQIKVKEDNGRVHLSQQFIKDLLKDKNKENQEYNTDN